MTDARRWRNPHPTRHREVDDETRTDEATHGWTEHRIRDVDARVEKTIASADALGDHRRRNPGTSEAEGSVRVMMPALKYHGRERLPSICGPACTAPDPLERLRHATPAAR